MMRKCFILILGIMLLSSMFAFESLSIKEIENIQKSSSSNNESFKPLSIDEIENIKNTENINIEALSVEKIENIKNPQDNLNVKTEFKDNSQLLHNIKNENSKEFLYFNLFTTIIITFIILIIIIGFTLFIGDKKK